MSWRPRAAARTVLGALLTAAAAAAAVAVVVVPAASDGDRATPSVAPSAAPSVALRATGDGPVTHVGFPYGPSVTSPTKDKPQSKLWFQDGAWWALLVNPVAEQVHIFELQDDQAWRDTGAVVDERHLSTADALWDGQQLRITTRTRNGAIRYLSFDYLPTARSYQLQPGFPVVLSDDGASSVALTVDSTGMIWSTFVQDSRLFVTHSTDASGRRWVVPYLPVGEEGVLTDDDISAIDSFAGQVGIMWSNQRAGAFYFLTREDGTPDQEWRPVEVPVEGPLMSDGHVDVLAASDGSVYAGVKTSLDDDPRAAGNAPLVMVLERSPAGQWTQHVAGTVADRMTRPQLVLSEESALLHLFYAAPSGGGRIYEKTSNLVGMRWAPGLGSLFMSATGATLNDVTGTKQAVDRQSGIVLLASDAATRRYYHAVHAPADGGDSAAAGPQTTEAAVETD